MRPVAGRSGIAVCRSLMWALALATAGCGSGAGFLAPADDGAVSVAVRAVRLESDGTTTFSVAVRNNTSNDVTLKMRCTAVELEQEQSGSWIRIEDLRLCAPPDRTRLPARTTLDSEDRRLLAAGRHRALVETIDGATFRSEPFTVPTA